MPAPHPTVAFVTCVEAGQLETQTVRLADGLRRFGGRLADAPVVAVTPRVGPPLSRDTRRRYDALGVTHLRVPTAVGRYAWYPFANKPAALLAAERAVSADVLVWLDADVLVVGEPDGFALPPDVDVAVCPTERNVGTSAPGDAYHGYWTAMCDALGLRLADVPMVTEHRDGTRIRAYFNGGVIAYRPASGYAAAYRDAVQTLFDARVRLPGRDGVYYHEQAAVGLAAVRAGLRWQPMSPTHNAHFGSHAPAHVAADALRTARVLHYHRAMRRENWPAFLGLFDAARPDARAWLEPYGPVTTNLPAWKKVANRLLRNARRRRADAYLATCRTV